MPFQTRVSSASGLVVKSNVAIVGPRVRFSAGALVLPFAPKLKLFTEIRFLPAASQRDDSLFRLFLGRMMQCIKCVLLIYTYQ